MDELASVSLSEARKALFTLESGLLGAAPDELKGIFQALKGIVADGQLFVMEDLTTAALYERSNDAYAAIKTGGLSTPFPITLILASFVNRSEAILIIALPPEVSQEGEAEALGYALVAVRLDRSVHWTVPASDYGGAVVAYIPSILSIIADSRSSVSRIEADGKLNKARIKNGKAPIPPYWRLDPPTPTILVSNATPKLVEGRGGTHASPRPHDRRGHPRRLGEGKTVWVRASRVNALIPHLTRDRSFYEVRA